MSKTTEEVEVTLVTNTTIFEAASHIFGDHSRAAAVNPSSRIEVQTEDLEDPPGIKNAIITRFRMPNKPTREQIELLLG
jgi:hypothetical protein